jgi:hypothetical protein
MVLADWDRASPTIAHRRGDPLAGKGTQCQSGKAGPHAYLASAYALKGEADRAASELAEARRLVRGNLYSSITSLKATIPFGVPKIRALFEATYLAGLRKAGVPEE